MLLKSCSEVLNKVSVCDPIKFFLNLSENVNIKNLNCQ